MPEWQGTDALLHEPLEAPGARRRWRAEAGGRPAVAIETELATTREAAAVGERLRRLHAHPDPHLTPVLGWAVEGTRAWVLIPESAASRRLAELLRNGPLSPGEAAAAAWSVLSGLEAMHEAGVAHGSVSPQTILVAADGSVRLDGGWFLPEARAGSGQLAADVAGAGAAGLAALGIAPTAGVTATPAELAAPALSRMMRAIAAGASGSNVAGARMALTATAGPLVEPDGLARARSELARRAGGQPPSPAVPTVQAPPPAPAPRPAPPPAAPPTPARPEARPPTSPAPAVPSRRYVATAADFERPRAQLDWSRLAVPLIAVGAVLVVLAIGWIAVRALTQRPASSSVPPAAAKATPTPRPHATPRSSAPPATPTPSATPAFGPASAPPVKSVTMTLSGCAPGGSCSAEIIVNTSAAPAANDITWTVRAFDPCTGATTDAGSGHFTEQQGWTSIDVNQAVRLPASSGQLQVAAVTGPPAVAASAPVTVGQGSC